VTFIHLATGSFIAVRQLATKILHASHPSHASDSKETLSLIFLGEGPKAVKMCGTDDQEQIPLA
jgi:hypothetical protein